MRSMVTIWTLAVILLCAQPAWGASNNGFDTGLFYGIRSTTGDYLTHPAGDPLADWTAFSPEGDHAAWSLTFSGRGTNDARLFVMGNWGTSTPPGPWVSDFDGTGGVDGTIKIVEYNGSGSQIFQIYHGALLGCESNAPGAFRKISGGSIRYNPVNNTLIVSAKMMYYHILGGCTNMPLGMVDTIRTAYAWEFTLPSGGSTTLVETYVGPTVGALKLDAQDGDYGPSAIADGPVIDVGEDGTLYMIGPSVGTPLTEVRVWDDEACPTDPCETASNVAVEGAQTGVTVVNVDDGAGGPVDFGGANDTDLYVGNTIKFATSGTVVSIVSIIEAPGGAGNGAIEVDNAVTVNDNEEILRYRFRGLNKPTE
ncbi:MAG: hypothetical protein JSV03_16695, partial [Planctomycetota bacterium]